MARRSGSNGEKTAADLRRTALRLFAEKGYAAVSMRQIAAAMGLQAGALYLYTPDKQTLLADIMAEHMEDLLSAWAACPKPGPDDPTALFDAFVRFHIRHHLSRGAEVFLSYMELRALEPANFARVEMLRRSYEAVLTEILAGGRRAGAFRFGDDKVASYALIAMLTGVNTWYRPEGRLSAAEVEALYLDLARAMVGRPAEPPR